MRNLKDETIEVLWNHGKTPDDVVWVGCYRFAIKPQSFWELADKLYDNGCGGEEVAVDLLIVGSDWWLERHSYDGAEWWEYKTLPIMPCAIKHVQRIMRDSDHWRHDLSGMNDLIEE